jgi:hypothetical protein
MILIGQSAQYLTNVVLMVFHDLSYNQLDGHIPTKISTKQSLAALFLQHSYLSGQLPQELGGLKSLMNLDLSHNMLEGNIPTGFFGYISKICI